jgi:ATP-dependent helicase/nuclease subunit B
MAIVARTLEPYASHLKPVFLEHGLPFHTTASTSAAREPCVQAALLLARCLRDDFPAGPLFDLLRSGLFLGPGDPARRVDAWERLARRHHVAGGSEIWIDHLPRWASRDASGEDRHRQAERLAALVRRLARQAATLRRTRTWVEWAESFRSLLARTIDGYQEQQAPAWTEEEAHDPGVTLLEALLFDMATLLAAKVPFTVSAAFDYLESAVAGATISIGSVAADGRAVCGDQGGVRVLDAMQARGLAFDAVILVGMNADLFPRRGREDPFLTDDDRRRIRTALRRPLPVAAEAKDEERLLLALLLGSARDHLAVSWQRADESGKARVPSLALREIARIALATTDLAAAERRALTIGAHPADQARSAVERHALLASREAVRAIALLAGGPRPAESLLGQPAIAALGVDRDATLPGLGFLAAIEGTWPTPFDALPGEAGRPQDVWSPSRLERLGSCPQHFFFRHVLRAGEWEEPAAPHEFEAREMGALAHEVLRDVYSALLGEGLLAGGPGRPGDIVRRAEAHLDAAWARHTAELAARSRALYPALWDLTAGHWLASLKRFLRLDLAEVLAAGRVLDGFEVEVVRAIPLGDASRPREPVVETQRAIPTLAVRGRFDRTGRDRDGAIVVSDYKTSGALERHVSQTEMLKGSRLQMGLYALMADPDPASPGGPGANPGRPEVRAEVLGVGPRYADDDPEGGGPARARLDPAEFASIRDGLLETLRVLASLAERGLFPLNEKSRFCPYCPFARACRRTHRPTLDRLAANPDLREYFMTLAKNSRSPRLR